MIYVPKISRIILSVCVFVFISRNVKGQMSFTISTSLCPSETTTLYGSSGSFSASNYFWTSNPVGAVFSGPNASVTTVSFPSAGIYAVTLGGSVGTSTLYTTHSTSIHAAPVLTLSSQTPSICVGQDATLTASGANSYTWSPLTGLYFFSNSVANVSTNATAVYFITGTNTLGCSGNTSYTIHVDNYPSIFLSAGTNTVCPGYTTAITAGGANSYTWASTTLSSSVIQASIAASPGIYTITGAIVGCLTTSEYTIHQGAPISISLTLSRGIICTNLADSIVAVDLSATGANQYVWEPFTPGRMTYSIGPSTSVSPSVSTCYTVTGTKPGCKGVSVACVQVSVCTSIDEFGSDMSLNVFPNPVRDKFFFKANRNGVFTIKIVDMTGALLLQENTQLDTDSKQEVLMKDFSPGIYCVYFLTAGENPKMIRVVKE